MYKRIMEKAHFTESPIVYMPNFLPKEHVYQYISGYKNYILYLGRLSREKGILTLLKAHKISNCKHRLIIAGEGLLKQQINDYIEENNITNVELAGFVKGQELAELVNNAHTIVVPSEWYENCPYSLLEALGKGKIVIASKIGGLPELIKDKETGYLFEVGNEQDLADKIKFVMSMKKREYNKMSRQVLKEAEEKFYWDKYIDKLLKEYKKLIKNNKKNLVR